MVWHVLDGSTPLRSVPAAGTAPRRGATGPPEGRPRSRAALLMLWAFAATIALGLNALWTAVLGGQPQAPGLVGAALGGTARLLPFVVFVPAALAVAARLGSPAWGGWRRASVGFTLRVSAYVLLAGIGVTTVLFATGKPGLEERLAAPTCRWVWAVSGAGALLVFSLAPGLFAGPGGSLGHAIDLALFNATLAVLCGELVITAAARLSASPLLDFSDLAGGQAADQRVEDTLRRFRFKPHARMYDKELNSGGYLDDEPFAAGKRDFVVALLADSFGVGGGVVPFDYVFATVAERELRRAVGDRCDRVAVHNLGVAKIGLPEYFYLMRTEALRLNPKVVALCLFIGNDLEGGLTQRSEKAGRALLGNWRVVELPRRLWRLEGERRRGNASVIGTVDGFPAGVPDYVHDYRLERGTFSEQRFFGIEAERTCVCDARRSDVAERYEGAYDYLRRFKAVLGDRLLVVLIPDEFQVNDTLWQALAAALPNRASLDRDVPQRNLVAFCAANRIAVLDLLPALREAQRQAPTYHLRDTHWNAHGNRVAGEAIAGWILHNTLAGVAPPADAPAR